MLRPAANEVWEPLMTAILVDTKCLSEFVLVQIFSSVHFACLPFLLYADLSPLLIEPFALSVVYLCWPVAMRIVHRLTELQLWSREWCCEQFACHSRQAVEGLEAHLCPLVVSNGDKTRRPCLLTTLPRQFTFDLAVVLVKARVPP